MTDAQFSFIAGLLKMRSGLTLTRDKVYLLETRLMPIARQNAFCDVPKLLQAVEAAPTSRLADSVVEAMTTNETLFFRDRHPFEAVREHVLPAILRERGSSSTLRIWSAACSTGQEPYSIAMLLRDSFPQLASWRVEIVATDIAPGILQRAEAATYSNFEVQRGLPIHLLVKHFDQVGDNWRAKSQLRSMVRFELFNLLTDPKHLGMFDIIFCRNVLIYFDQPTKAQVLGRLAQRLTPNGALVLGGAESVFGISEKFVAVDGLRGVYSPTVGSAARKSVFTFRPPARAAGV